jgi:SAM-dependent methyltransferase
MNGEGGDSWNVGELPFIWKPLATPHNPDGLPDTLPFTVSVNPRTGTLVQAANPDVASALRQAYELGSAITGQMDASGIGRGYADDFLRFMIGDGGERALKGRRILEVGCGNGFLLSRLAEQGADVLGIDPGEHSNATYDVPIIRDFFPSRQVTGPFDTIIAFAVLEHVEDPLAFLDHLFSLVAPGGEVVLGVPDCGPYIGAGDVSCLFHEHWSYFDLQTLRRTLEKAGSTDNEVCVSRFGGMLYARGQRSHARRAAGDPGQSSAVIALDNFRALAERGIAMVARFFAEAVSRDETIGVYVPSRIVNALFAGSIDTTNCRFFDDNPLMKGSYFPGLAIPVEDRADLVSYPTNRVLVMSRSFGDTIAAALRALLPPQVAITRWDELFSTGTEA